MEFKKHALVLAVIEQLQRRGSRVSKTHVQKTLFLLTASGLMDVPFDFILYKHGPYSFDIENELEQMKSYAAVTSEPAPDGYGMILRSGTMEAFVRAKAPLTEAEKEAIARICEFVDTKNVPELERLATAAWIRTRENATDTEAVAERLNKLKPHVSIEDALRADKTLVPLLA